MKVHDRSGAIHSTLASAAPARTLPSSGDGDRHVASHDAGKVGTIPKPGAVSPKTPATAAEEVTFRSPEAAVAFCDRFNHGEHLHPKELQAKEDLMVSGGLKLARCAPHLMMADNLGPLAEDLKWSDKAAPEVWIQGDGHFGNAGVIQDADENAVFGLNDFDMTCKGSPAMDLGRCAFSLQRYMMENHIDPAKAPDVVAAMLKAYQTELKAIAGPQGPRPAYITAAEAHGPIKKTLDSAGKITRHEWIKKYAAADKDGNWHFVASKKVEPVDLQTANKVTAAIHEYESTLGDTPRVARPLKIFGVAQKLQSGGSSQGQPRYYVLVENAKKGHPPIILEVKEELPPPMAGYKPGDPAATAAASKKLWSGNLALADAKQVVCGQKAMGGCSNPLTGYTQMDGVSYLCREREPCKAYVPDEDLKSVDSMTSMAEQLGTIWARAHGRSREQAEALVDWSSDPKFVERGIAYTNKVSQQAGADVQAYQAAHPQADKDAGLKTPDLGD